MNILRFCRSCSGPRPRAASRCPWCHKHYGSTKGVPEHLFSSSDRASRPSTMRGPVQKGELS